MSNKNAKLTLEIVQYLRTHDDVDLKAIAEQYGVTVKHLNKVRNKNHLDSWKWVEHTLTKTNVARKSNLTKAEIRDIRSSSMTLSQVADWYGISVSFASLIRRREKYKSVV